MSVMMWLARRRWRRAGRRQRSEVQARLLPQDSQQYARCAPVFAGHHHSVPGGAFYHASKYAVEALSDALRMEVAQFGIDVVLIEPGPVKTPWNDIAAASLSSAAPGTAEGGGGNGAGSENGSTATAGDDPYAAYKTAVGASFGRTQAGLLGRFGSTSQDVAKVITQAVTARRSRPRYLINPVAKSLVAMNRVLPARAYDSVVRRQYGLPS